MEVAKPVTPHVRLEWFGRGVIRFFEELGGIAILLGQTIRWVLRGVLEPRQTTLQMARMGVESIPIILVTGTFSGMVLAFQTTGQLLDLGAQIFAGGLVTVTLAREAGPVFTGITMAGRSGAGFAAEIGTMNVTEQIDALRVLATDPVRYLVLPRVLAGILMLPMLTMFANVAGFVGGLGVAAAQGVAPETYLNSVKLFLDVDETIGGLIKSAAFGLLIALIASYRGLRATGGAEGVGRATTTSVVTAIVYILVINYFLDLLLY